MTTAPDSDTLASLIEAFRQREQVGIAKYGVTVDRSDLTHVEWLQHALEESMDQCLYLKRAIETVIALINERDRLRDSLLVFTKHYEPWMDEHPSDAQSHTFSRHTFGQLRAARKALQESVA